MREETTTAPPEAEPPEPAEQSPDLGPAHQVGILIELAPLALKEPRLRRKVGRFLRTLQRRELVSAKKSARAGRGGQG